MVWLPLRSLGRGVILTHNVQTPSDFEISTRRRGGGGGRGKGLIYKARSSVQNYPSRVHAARALRVILGKYVIERNEVLFNVCIASCFQIRGPRESSYAHLLLRLGFS